MSIGFWPPVNRLYLRGLKGAQDHVARCRLMLALTTAKKFLGMFEVFVPVAVGMMTGESGLPTIQETIRRIASTMGIDTTTIDNMIVTDKVPQLGDAPTWRPFAISLSSTGSRS